MIPTYIVLYSKVVYLISIAAHRILRTGNVDKLFFHFQSYYKIFTKSQCRSYRYTITSDKKKNSFFSNISILKHMFTYDKIKEKNEVTSTERINVEYKNIP